jgi:hypothetical protein
MSNNSDYSDYYDSDYDSFDSIDSDDIYLLELEGDGFLDSISKAKDEVVRRLKGISLAFQGTRQNIKKSGRDVLEKYGNDRIVKIQLCRTPISQKFTQILNLYNKLTGNEQHDTFFHLYLVATLESGKTITIEKNQEINVEMYKKREVQECIDVNIGSKYLTPNIMLEKTKKGMGEKRFFEYDSISNNCQNFIFNLLKYNDIYINEMVRNFVIQDTSKLLSNFAQKLARLATDTVNRLGLVLEGEGY